MDGTNDDNGTNGATVSGLTLVPVDEVPDKQPGRGSGTPNAHSWQQVKGYCSAFPGQWFRMEGLQVSAPAARASIGKHDNMEAAQRGDEFYVRVVT